MAYNFTDATLLGYQVNKNYLGEGVFALSTIKNISIEGILDNRVTNADSEGVKENFQKISGFLTGIVNAYDAVIVNGYNLGTGKVSNLSFPDQNPIRLGSYKYDIEIVENSDFSNIQTGDIYGTFLSGVNDKILSLDETLNFDNAANGDYSYNHDLNIQYYDTGSDLFTKSKNFANSVYSDSLKLGLIGPFSGFYDVLKTKKNYFSETYDLINKRCGFSKKILINKNYNNNYTTTLNHTITLDTNGKISVTEQGVIKGLDNTLNYTADNYFNTELANSYSRCQNVYNTYVEKNLNIGGVCGYQNINKLIEINGISPIGANFNNIAFDYNSFSSNCSSLGLDPATILNDLGGVDFSYNYVVIRAKTASSINNDSISNLGNGTINITNVGPSSLVPQNYYRFFVMCKEGWTTVRFYGVDYNSTFKDSLFNQPFNIGKTSDWFNNSLEYNVSYVNDPAFEGNVINTYNITVNKDIQEVGVYTEQGEIIQVGQVNDINDLDVVKTKYQAAKTRASTNYPTYKLKNSSFSAGNLGVDYIYKIIISDVTSPVLTNGVYLRSSGGITKFIGPPRNDGDGPPVYSLYPEIWWYSAGGYWALSYLGEIDGEINFKSYDLINWQTNVDTWDGNAAVYKTTYNNNFSYSIEKTNDNSILEGDPYYKSLSMKIDDQSPTNLYKEYIIANKNPKNVLFLFGNQVEIGNRSVNINGTLVRPTGNFWAAPIAFPLTDLKSKSISGALNLISNDAYIDNINYSYDSDNNFSFNLSVKYLDKVV